MPAHLADTLKDPLIASLIALSGVVVGVMGILVGVIVARKGMREKKPVWIMWTTNLVNKRVAVVKGVEVLHDGTPIPTLSVSRISFWNDGRQPIVDSDLNTADRIAIAAVDGVELLSAEVTAATSLANQLRVRLSNSDNRAVIEFGYLNHRQGALIQVAHTGTRNTDLMIRGEIRGVDTLLRRRASQPHLIWRRAKPLLVAMVVALVFGLSLGVFLLVFDNKPTIFSRSTGGILTALYLGILLYGARSIFGRQPPRPLLSVYEQLSESPGERRLRWLPDVSRKASSARLYEEHVLRALRAYVGLEDTSTRLTTDGKLADAVVDLGTKRIAVEVMSGGQFVGRRVIDSLIRTAQRTEADGVLLVHDGRPSEGAIDHFRRLIPEVGVPVGVVFWETTDAAAVLRNAINTLRAAVAGDDDGAG